MDCSFLLLAHMVLKAILSNDSPILAQEDLEGLFWSNDNPAGTTPVAKYFQAHA